MELPNAGTPSRKTVVLALAGFFVIVLFILISIFSGSSGKQQVSKQAVVESPDKVNSSIPSVSPPAPSEIVDDWQTYQNSQYSIKYPKDWQIEELKFPNGDLGTSFHPATPASTNPSLLIVNITSDTVTSSQQQQSYLIQGFDKSSITIDSTQATKLSGTFPPKSASSSGFENVIQASHVFFKKGNSEYLLKYAYLNKGQNTNLEKLFNKIISSLKFN